MEVTRRQLFRRLAGLGTAGVLWVSTRYVLSDGAHGPGRYTATGTVKTHPETSTGPSIITPEHHQATASNSLRAAESTMPASTTTGHYGHETTTPTSETATPTSEPSPSTTESVAATTHHETTTAPSAASLELAGNIGPVLIPAGSIVKIVGDINLTGDLIVEGILTGVDTFTLEGNGHQIIVQHGGRIDLAGQPKTAWARWGDPVTGWRVGDRLEVAPTALQAYNPISATWQGSWAATVRPDSAPDLTLIDGRIARPEVANLSQTIRMQNLSRVMFHEAAGVQSLRWLRIVDSGVAGQLGFYSIHFHLLADSSRGSLVEGVVVEGSKFRAFVPHGSHGITMRDCVAYNGLTEAFWWDEPAHRGDVSNESNGTVWERCLVLSSVQDGVAFALGSGQGNRCIDCAAAGGFKLGIFWTHKGRNVWELERAVVHNLSNPEGSIRAWQNDGDLHQSNDLTIYNTEYGLLHGAYNNQFQWNRLLIQGPPIAIELAALGKNTGPVKYTDVRTDGELLVGPHKGSPGANTIERATFTQVRYSETTSAGDAGSKFRYVDCGLIPSQFVFTKVHPTTVIEVVEGGVLVHSWAGGVWS